MSSLGLLLSSESVRNVPRKPPGLDCNPDTETRLKTIPKKPQCVEEPGDRRAQDTQEARAESVARMGAAGG